MPKKSAKKAKKSGKKVAARKPATKPVASLAVPLESITDVIASHSELDSLPQPRTFDEANHWLEVHNAWVDKVSDISSQVIGAVSATRESKTRLDPKKLLEYVEHLSELARVTAKIQRSTESLTRCFVQ